MNIILRKGTRVRILMDLRKGGSARGRTAKLVGYDDCGGWILFSENRVATRESHDLPRGYIEWNPAKEKFPGKQCGMRAGNPIFTLDDNSEIRGSECYWRPINEKTHKRLLKSISELTGIPEKVLEAQTKGFEEIANGHSLNAKEATAFLRRSLRNKKK
ncbi:MAG: hypothetical protein AAB897_03720 [Patescibacteria group bacterium]